MAKEFHLFPRLPLKLREMIWKNAIRSNQPGVHVFTIYDHVVEVDTESLHSEITRLAFRTAALLRRSLQAGR